MVSYGFGAMRLPLKDETDVESVDFDKTQEMIDRSMGSDFNYFDTAYPYHNGKSEEALRKCLVERYPRDSYLLADKLPSFFLNNKEDMEKYFEEELKRCGVDYFDYYMLHNVSTWTLDALRQFDAYDFMKNLKKEGKVKHIGISLHDNAEILEEVLKEMPEIEFVQLQINYLDWENESIQAKQCYEIARKYGKEIIIMEPMKGGTLVDVPVEAENILKKHNPVLSIPGWALKYAMSLEGVSYVLSGTTTLEQLEDNLKTMENFKKITLEEKELLNNVVEIIKDAIEIPCTNCNYCLESCPENIPISKFFELYNIEKRLPSISFSPQQVYYRTYAMKTAKASECVYCEECVEKCPQHLEIPEYLEEVVELFEDENY